LPLYGDGVAILPLVMGITMFIQQKMMPTQSSGQQKFMAYFMTGFFVLLFNTFPSGLNLYYTLFNALTILQQKYLTPSVPEIASTQKK
jgi:YidC/Oxa1 family membrane protein insertase